MIKATITRLFIGGGLAIIAGAIVAVIAIGIAMANDIFVVNGPDVVGVRGSALAIALLGLAVVGAVAIMAGLIAGLVAWIGALLNTWQLDSKAWFVALLLLGIFNFGFFAMIAFLVAGPDGTTDARLQKARPPERHRHDRHGRGPEADGRQDRVGHRRHQRHRQGHRDRSCLDGSARGHHRS